VVGCNALDERSTIFSVGPITVDPEVQDHEIGRALMTAVLDRSAESRPPGVRLLQAAYHNRSMSLYAKLGFDVREQFAAMQGSGRLTTSNPRGSMPISRTATCHYRSISGTNRTASNPPAWLLFAHLV
jgi:hypothetical protein